MTSFRAPDYDITLELSRGDFRKVAGSAFDVRVAFGDRRGRFSGMVIVPDGEGFPGIGQPAEAWLWAQNNRSSPAGTRVHVTIGEPCDPLDFDRFDELSKNKGLRLTGVITRTRAQQPRGKPA